MSDGCGKCVLYYHVPIYLSSTVRSRVSCMICPGLSTRYSFVSHSCAGETIVPVLSSGSQWGISAVVRDILETPTRLYRVTETGEKVDGETDVQVVPKKYYQGFLMAPPVRGDAGIVVEQMNNWQLGYEQLFLFGNKIKLCALNSASFVS